MLFWPDPAGAGSGPPGADKVVHAGLFALLVVTARLRLGARRRVLGAVLGYAAVSEVVQAALLSRRSGDLLDLVADVAGTLLAWAVLSRRDARREVAPPAATG